MHVLFRHLDPGQSGAVSSMVRMLEGYCQRFPKDRLTVMCTATSPLAKLGAHSNCAVEIVGRAVPREAHLLGCGDLAVRRLHRLRPIDVFWAMNVGLYLPAGVPQVLSVNNPHQVYPRDRAVPHPASRLRVSLLIALFRRSLRLSCGAIVQTELMKQYLEAVPGCPSTVRVVPKAVVAENDSHPRALSSTCVERLKTAANSVKLLYVATQIPHKNHKVLIPVMDRLRQRERAATLVLTIPAEKWVEIGGSAAQDLIDSGHVIPLGWVEKSELESLYAACDVCVMPSLLESLSSTHIEAMYWKKPQVVADLPYARDLCRDAAFYADPRDPDSWCSKIELLLDDVELRQGLVTKGLRRIEDFPASWSAMAEKIRSALVDAVASTSQRTDALTRD